MKEQGTDITANVADIAKCQALKPTEDLYIGKKGYKRTYRPDGSYEWSYGFKPNEGGKLTKEALEVGEHMAPFTRADTERHLAISAKAERVAMRDANGSTQYVEPQNADATAKSNGWGHAWRPRGSHVERGPQGMLFRGHRDGWEPLGVKCLGEAPKRLRVVARRNLQLDPSGNPWKYLQGRWQPA